MRGSVATQIAAERADLLGFLAGVGDDDWSKPTVCTGWSVKDVLAHMVEGELNVGRVYRGEARELGFVDPEEGVARWRPLPGPAVRAALWQHGTATQRVLDAMTDEAWHAPIRAFGCREIRQLVRLHLFDLAVHGHDLTDALGASPVWGDRLPFAVEFVVRAAPFTLTRLGATPTGALRVEVDGRSWVVDGRDGAWRLTEAGAPATVRLGAEDLVLATTGRRAVEAVLDRVEGERSVAARILGAWQVVAPTPPSPSR